MKTRSIIAATLILLPFTMLSYISDTNEGDGVQQDKSKAIPLAQRIGHTDQSKARAGKNVHDGTGTLYMQTQLNRDAIYCLNFMHHGPLMPKSSIGHHFHNDTDEMFLILDGE